MKNSFPRPKVLVSRCLGFAACRYDGQIIKSAVVELLTGHVDFIDFCPELEAGLGVPRPPIRLCMTEDGIAVFQPALARTVTSELQQAIDSLSPQLSQCDGAILKSRSPSCGIRDAKVYRGLDKPHFLQWSSGLLAQRLMETSPGLALDDEQRLTNFVLREHFLIKLYILARFRAIAVQAKLGQLVSFHASHKLLLLVYNQSRFRLCGKIVANHERLPAPEVFQAYASQLKQILQKPFRRQGMVNSLYHAHGWLSAQLAEEERRYIVNTIEEYRDERIPLQAVTRLLEAQALRFKQDYLLSQRLLRPFPAQLSDLSDSGKGREVE